MRWTVPLIVALSLLAVPAWAQSSPQQSWSFSVSTEQGRLGVEAQSMTPELRGFFGAPKTAGVLVARVLPNTPAARARLLVGDVVTRVEATAIGQPADVIGALSNKKKGDWVDITVIRAKRQLTLRAQLDRDPAPALAPSFGSFGDWFRGLPGGELQLGFPDAAQPERFDQRLRELEKRFDELRKRLDEKRDGNPSTT
jgi:hypothetical protein